MIKNQKEGVGDAQKYMEWAEKAYTWQYIEKPSFLRNLKPYFNQTTKVIEAGCGAGRTINFLKQQGIRDANILGIDVDLDLLAGVRQRFPQVKLIHNSISEDLAIDEESVGLVTCHNVLHYLDNEQFSHAINNFYRWLKKDGRLFVMTPHPVHMAEVVDKSIAAYFRRGRKTVKTRWGEEAPYYQRVVSDYLNQLITAGFVIELVDEPEIIAEGKALKKEFEHYSRSPARLAILARKL